MTLVLAVALALAGLGLQANAELGPPACTPAALQKIAFGVATAAYQVEGCTSCDGRSVSIWDKFVNDDRSRILDRSTAEVATDMYHKYEADFKLMKRLGVRHHRFSIAWGRIIPSGRKGGAINQKGVDFYNKMIDSMIANGVTPAATLYHWDLPQANQDAYGGFVSPQVVADYVYFAETCFKLFGDRVKRWITFNEPWIVCNSQWGNGDFAPGKNLGDHGKWACGHYLLLSHANAVDVYRKKYNSDKAGRIGMAIWTEWSEPFSNSAADKRAAQNKMDVDFGWFADPVHFGDYPQRIKQGSMGKFIPNGGFTDAEKTLLRRSYDFFGMTFYTGKYAKATPGNPLGWIVSLTGPDGKSVGPVAQSYWLRYVPWSVERILEYVDKRYGRPDIWFLENGFSEPGETQRSGDARFRDPLRTQYFKGYMEAACRAVTKGINFTNYYLWSWLDNWEWREGYNTRFGIVHVDFNSSNRTRTPKESALWMSKYAFTKGMQRDARL